MALSCGGRGPCCHIGYPHRHCEHCDYVIPTHHTHWPYWSQPYWGTVGGLVNTYATSGTAPLQALLGSAPEPEDAHPH